MHLVRILPFLALVFIGFLAWKHWQTLATYEWSLNELKWFILSYCLYPLSLGIWVLSWQAILQNMGVVLARKDHVYVYCLNILSQRLPIGLLWSIGGRVAYYDKFGLEPKTVVKGATLEIALQILSAFLLWAGLEIAGLGAVWRAAGTLPWQQRLPVLLLAVVVIFGLILLGILQLFKKRNTSLPDWRSLSLTRGLLWMGGYSLAWTNAGLMLWLVSKSLGIATVSVGAAVASVAFYGVIGHLSFVMPLLSLGAKEVGLIFILAQFMPLLSATLVTVLFRMLLTVADATWPMLVVFLARRGHWFQKGAEN
jgi:hypothetical protein